MAADALLLPAAGSALALGVMGALWLFHLRRRDAGVVDVGWAGNLGLLALLYAAFGSGDPSRRLAVAVLGGVWAFRLAFHIAARMKGKPEEGRYVALRAEWAAKGHDVPSRFLAFFLFQGVLDVVLSTPFLLAAMDPRSGFAPAEIAGVVLWLVAVAGESLADAQLTRWKTDPANRRKSCRAGLWSLSRHPNYFFESLVWVAFALFASASPWGLLSWLCPALILFFLLRVTGIPATEEQALRSRADYAEYQRTTSAFVPWFPRKG